MVEAMIAWHASVQSFRTLDWQKYAKRVSFEHCPFYVRDVKYTDVSVISQMSVTSISLSAAERKFKSFTECHLA
jgi:hypothetical protein